MTVALGVLGSSPVMDHLARLPGSKQIGLLRAPREAPTTRHRATDGSKAVFARGEPMEVGTATSFIGVMSHTVHVAIS